MDFFEKKYPAHNKTLVLNKIDINTNTSIKKKIEELFTDPAKYFSIENEGHSVVIGRKQKIPRLDNLRSYSIVGNTSLFPNIYKRKSYAKQNSLMSQTNLSVLHEKIKKPPKNTFEVISDIRINEIFDQFKYIKQKNKQNVNSFISDLNPDIQKRLLFQEYSLKVNEDLENKSEVIAKWVSKKSNKKQKELLMNRTDGFRVKKEVQDKLEDSKGFNEKFGVNSWVISLRKNEGETGKTFNYINMGSLKNPHWQLVKSEHPHLIETIRNPERFFDKDVMALTTNEHFRKTHSSFKLVTHQLDNMKIIGKDLLQCEYENFKMLKGKKILHTGMSNLQEYRKINEVIAIG